MAYQNTLSELKRPKREDISEEERRTVYITSLPAQFSERELHNLFAFASGYQCMQMYTSTNGRGGTGCFALFDTNSNALAAVNHLQGYMFDEPTGFTLKTEMARRNLKPPATDAGPKYASAAPATHQYPQYGQMQMAYMPAQAAAPQVFAAPSGDAAGYNVTPTLDGPYTQAMYNPYQMPQYQAPMGAATGVAHQSAPSSYSGQSSSPPCDTLCVWSVPFSQEMEMVQWFRANAPEMTTHKWTLSQKTGKPMAWVQFQDSGAATDAMQRLNGQLGMKLEYSRNPLGKRNRE